MVKQLRFKMLLLLCALVAGSASVGATDEVYYTLDPKAGTNNGYGNNCDIEIEGLTWNVEGNSQMIPWRLGGKSLTTVDRSVYSKTAIDKAITKIDLTVGAATITVNSLKLIVASSDSYAGDDVIDEVSATFEASSTITFEPSPNKQWPKDSYYKFVFNVSTTSTSNKFVEFSKAEFYAPESATSVAKPTFTPDAGEVAKGTKVALKQDNATYIIYTTDGSTPTWDPLHGTEYVSPIAINSVMTIKAIAIDNNENVSAVATASYTLIKVEPEISFAIDNYDVPLDQVDNFVSQALTNPHNLINVTYSVTNTSVASINSTTGVVTLKKGVKGKTTVNATFAGNDEYLEGTASYTINVYNPNEVVFDFASKTSNYGSGVTTTSDGNEYITSEKYWTNGVITLTTAGKYRWWDNDGTLRFYSNDPASTIVVTAADGYLLTDIAITGGQGFKSDDGAYSSSNGKWAGTTKSVTLTYNATSSVNVKTITVDYTNKLEKAVESYGWASYITPAPVQFAPGDAYVVTAATVADGLTLEEVTEAPAGTPVLLKGEGTKNITVVASATAPTTNLLSVCDGTKASDKTAYVLAKNGEGACFKKWTGEASDLNGRVVLLLDNSSSRSSYDLDGEAAGISLVENGRANNDGSVYNLSGQRVAQPTKGLYIVNGKKVLMK